MTIKNLKAELYREDYYLLIIFIMMGIAIVVKSYFHLDGHLSPDSTNYLTLAQNLLNGNGYYVSAYGETGQDKEFFAIWPVGYPTLIFVVAKITGLSVFWASKFLNILLILIILIIFRSLFKKNAYIYGLILLFSAYIDIFSYTWSETLFIVALLWFASSIYFFTTSPTKILTLYSSIMIASLLLFMSRYIGAFSFGIIGLLGLYYGLIKKEKFISIMLIGIAILNIEIMILYLYLNYSETGFLTGMQRIASLETNIELFYRLMNAIFSETLIATRTMAITMKAIVLFFIQIFTFGFLLWQYRNNISASIVSSNSKSTQLSRVFTIIGLSYLFIIIIMRWITQFDAYSYRLMGPGTFLLFIATIAFIEHRVTKEFFNVFKNIIIFFAMFSFLFNVPYKAWESSKLNPTYLEAQKLLKEKFTNIEKNSIIIFAPKHLNYLYINIEIREPYSFPYSLHKEKWSEFITRISFKKEKNIYLFINKKQVSPKEFDQSVLNFINKYHDGTLVKLK